MLSGELDLVSGPELESTIRVLCDSDTTALTIDLRKLSFMDCTGLRAMLEAATICAERACSLQMFQGPANVQRLFEISGLEVALAFVRT